MYTAPGVKFIPNVVMFPRMLLIFQDTTNFETGVLVLRRDVSWRKNVPDWNVLSWEDNNL